MAWAKPKYGKGRIDWAGELLAADSGETSERFSLQATFDAWADLDLAIEIINNWRSVHSYPLQAIKMTLKRRAKGICPSAIVAQRLKRFASIRLKLSLSKKAGYHPNLSQMQDIGGCRAVMETVRQVRTLEKKFLEASKKNPHRGPQFDKTTDYIANPKMSGYRGVHLVYRFRTTSPTHSCYNGQRIEIQLRSKLQHYWATAVETYSTFTGDALKSNIGPDKWKRFFALVASSFAVMEKSPLVPGTPTLVGDLHKELRALYISLNVYKVLGGWSAATKYTEDQSAPEYRQAAMYLLTLDSEEFSVTVSPYGSEDLPQAAAAYEFVEKNSPQLQAVLVSVDSLAALKAAYPNYFLDTSNFLRLVKKAVERVKEKVHTP